MRIAGMKQGLYAGVARDDVIPLEIDREIHAPFFLSQCSPDGYPSHHRSKASSY